MNYGGIVPALEEPGLLVHTSPTQPRPVEPNIAWSCVRITQCGHLKAKKKKKKQQRKKNTENSLCPKDGRAFLSCKPTAWERLLPAQAVASRSRRKSQGGF